MLTLPNGKINLGLHILDRREDGYHDIDSCFYPLTNCYDALEIVESKSPEFTLMGDTLDIPDSQNIALKAYDLLSADHNIPPIHTILQKKIPSGAGLGGGSSDAGFMLRMLRDSYLPDLDDEVLMAYAQKIGADVPFFILNKPSIVGGIGEKITPIDLDLSKYEIRLAIHEIHISTPWAFQNLEYSTHSKALAEIIRQPISTWKNDLKNDFESLIFEKYPVIRDSKEKMYDDGALYASMSGTGATVYGIFAS